MGSSLGTSRPLPLLAGVTSDAVEAGAAAAVAARARDKTVHGYHRSSYGDKHDSNICLSIAICYFSFYSKTSHCASVTMQIVTLFKYAFANS
jgi:hypothetical protein